MYIKAGIVTLASAAFLFTAGHVSAAKQIEEMTKFNLSSATSLQTPLSTGHYIVATADTTSSIDAQTMTDAYPAAQQENENVKQFSAVLGNNTSAQEPQTEQVYVDMSRSADEIISKPLYNNAGNRIGTIHDIIVDRTGDMMNIVVADGGMMSVGDKKAAFDSDLLSYDNVQDRYIMNISEQDITDASAFSYDPNKASMNVETLPPEGLSVKKLIGTKLVDHNDEVVADIENISFNFRDSVDQLIIGYDKILGMGGETAAVDFSKIRLVEDRKGTRFQLTGNQSAELSTLLSE